MAPSIPPAQPLEEQRPLSTGELCRVCHTEETFVAELVQEGVIAPTRSRKGEWIFEATCVVHVARATRLRHDLGLNTAGAVLALELLDEIDALRRRLARFEGGQHGR